MGVTGAALATAFAPLVSIVVCSTHFFSDDNEIRFIWHWPKGKLLLQSASLGMSGMISELSSAVTTMVFNFLILSLTGNVGVAAYGVIANYALIAVAVFNGIAQGGQPLVSEAYGKSDRSRLKLYLRLSVGTAIIVAIVFILIVSSATTSLVSLFNSENNGNLLALASTGLKLYFCGYLVAGVNMILMAYFSATDQPKIAFVSSLLRGVIAIIICALFMSKYWGMNGLWLSFVVAESITLVLVIIIKWIEKRKRV